MKQCKMNDFLLISFLLNAVIADARFPSRKREIVRRGPVSIRIFHNGLLSNWTKEPTRRRPVENAEKDSCILSPSLDETSPLLYFLFIHFYCPEKKLKVERLCKSDARAHLAHGNAGVESKV